MSGTTLDASSNLPRAIEFFERRVAAQADDADARYERWTAVSHARDALKRAVKARPKHAPSHAALGFAFDQGDSRKARQALACMREAQRLKPGDKIYEIYVITLLQESGREREALAALAAAAARHEIDLKGLQRQLNKAGMKADAAALLTNGFIRARNFLQPGRAQLVGAADRHAAAIQAWLDTFAQGKMPTEAAAFLYLALATEEIRGHG